MFLACLAGLCALFALAMFGGDLPSAQWWAWFTGFVGAAGLFVLLAKNKFGVFLGIIAIVCIRLLVALAEFL